jgi:multiple sugar transport system substrate-binding protein
MSGKFIGLVCSLLITIMMPLSFIGCSMDHSDKIERSTNGSEEKNDNLSNSKVKVKLAHWSTPSAKVIKNLISEYNETNTDKVQVEIIRIPSDKVEETLNLLMSSGQGPDIFGISTGNINTYVSNKWIADLSKYIDISFLSRFPTFAIELAKNPAYGGKFYTIASIVDTYRLVYNKDLFRTAGLNPYAPPKTLEELKKFAKKISDANRGNNKYGFALPAAEGWVAFCLGMEYPATFSGLNEFDFKTGKFDLTVFKPWLQTFIDMKNDGSLLPGETLLKNDIARSQFAEGNIGMIFAGSWDPSVYDLQFPASFDWGVAMPPAVDEASIGKGAINAGPGWCWAINGNTQPMAQAVKVWKFLYSEKFLGELYKAGMVLPIIKGITDNPDYKPILKNFDKFIPTEYDSAYPYLPSGIDDSPRWNAYLAAFTGAKTVDQALKEETDRLNKLLDKAVARGNLKLEDYIIHDYNPLHPMEGN